MALSRLLSLFRAFSMSSCSLNDVIMESGVLSDLSVITSFTNNSPSSSIGASSDLMLWNISTVSMRFLTCFVDRFSFCVISDMVGYLPNLECRDSQFLIHFLRFSQM